MNLRLSDVLHAVLAGKKPRAKRTRRFLVEKRWRLTETRLVAGFEKLDKRVTAPSR